MIRLPSRLLVVTDRHQARRSLEAIVTETVTAGARWIWLRDRDLEHAARRRLAFRLTEIVRERSGLLSIGGDIELAEEVGSGGIHVRDIASIAEARQALGPSVLVGLSAHSLADVEKAHAAGADYVTLSPIYPTASKPGYGPALGVSAVTAAARIGIPVVALGGISTDNAAAMRAAGATAVAVMGSVMGAERPADIVKAMLSTLEPADIP